MLVRVFVCTRLWRSRQRGLSHTAMLMQVEHAAALESTAERQGKNVEVLPDARLFFIDKVFDAFPSASMAVSHGHFVWHALRLCPPYLLCDTFAPAVSCDDPGIPDPLLPYCLQAQAVPEKAKSRKQTAREKVLRSKAIGDASNVRPVVW